MDRLRKPVVFIGPSCPANVARALIDAEFRPSARSGDIDALVRSASGGTIVLVDGLMVHGYPPSPRELARALDAGFNVVGAASLGAIRAAELWQQGMRGIGWIYTMFKSGRVNADDELVCLMHPATQAPLTVPFIRIRFAFERRYQRRAHMGPRARRLFNHLRRTYYEDRTPSFVRDVCAASGMPHIAELIFDDESDIKRFDAAECLRFVAGSIDRSTHDLKRQWTPNTA